MNQEVKERWLEALRSGEYKQTTSMLRSGNEFCCLGVLCDLFLKEREREEEWCDLSGCDSLTTEVQDWAGTNSDDPIIGKRRDGENISCITANDTFGKSFKQIANMIERNL